MIQINLLPHREIKRRARQRVFMAGTMTAAAVGVVVVILGHVILQKQLENQQARNQFLVSEIAVLDAKITQIKQLKEETEALLARKNVVETLQSNRTETVHLLDELVRQMPDGVHLKSTRQSGSKITLEGYAQSNARVSTLMENLERSAWLAGAELLESKQVTLNNQRLHEFSLEVQLKYDASQDTPHAPANLDGLATPASIGAPNAGAPAPAHVPPQNLPANNGGVPGGAGGVSPANAPAGAISPGVSSSPAAKGHFANPSGVKGMPKPEAVGAAVTDSISASQKRSMP